jgi:hypothetical protein
LRFDRDAPRALVPPSDRKLRTHSFVLRHCRAADEQHRIVREDRPPDRHDVSRRLCPFRKSLPETRSAAPIDIDAEMAKIDEAVRHAARSAPGRRFTTEDQPHRDHLRHHETVLFEKLLAALIEPVGQERDAQKILLLRVLDGVQRAFVP